MATPSEITNYERLTNPSLRALCRQHNLPDTGIKEELIERLSKRCAEKCPEVKATVVGSQQPPSIVPDPAFLSSTSVCPAVATDQRAVLAAASVAAPVEEAKPIIPEDPWLTALKVRGLSTCIEWWSWTNAKIIGEPLLWLPLLQKQGLQRLHHQGMRTSYGEELYQIYRYIGRYSDVDCRTILMHIETIALMLECEVDPGTLLDRFWPNLTQIAKDVENLQLQALRAVDPRGASVVATQIQLANIPMTARLAEMVKTIPWTFPRLPQGESASKRCRNCHELMGRSEDFRQHNRICKHRKRLRDD